MSQLFSKSALQEAISATNGHDLSEEIAIVTELYNDYAAGNTKDETRYEQRFNNLMFGQLLGYEENLHRHPKASTPVGSKIADVGLGIFEEGRYTFEGVKVVVELKGSGTLLDKKQASYGGQSPVDQGFGYKTSFKDCPWLLVSNFASLRLYRDNKQDFEVWTLEQLVDPSNEYYHLRTLLGLLRRSRLISSSGKSYTETLLSEVRIKQEKITKSFYREYKGLRFELINDIRHNNPDLDVETVVEKAQKIIDRIVFILFCEDKGLLPEHKLLERVREYQKRGRSPWLSLVDHFVDIDQGNPAIGIPQYNGGLFHRDEVLKTIHVGDAICHKFIDLGKYNFDDELSVNILGHIFEQSISDIEQLKVDLLGQEVETDQLVEKKESKRKKDGIFYTPEYIVDYIVQNSIMKYLEEKEQSCLDKVGKRGGYKTELEAYQAYQQILHHVKVLDPACGSGAFLVKVFDYLYRENERVGEIVGSLFDVDEIYKSILRNNIYGVDLNPESVEITKLSLWLKSAQKGKKLNNLDDNIKCGNSLIDDPAVAGERAFDRKKEFPDILGSSSSGGTKDLGFDVIVGNPPYVLCQPSNTSENILQYYKKKYKVSSYKIDLFHLFYELSTNILKSNGKLGFISPNTFFTNKYVLTLREFILKETQINEVVLFDKGVFDSASVDTAIIFFTKGKIKISGNIIYCNKMDDIGGIEKISTIKQALWNKDNDKIFNIYAIEQKSWFDNSVELGDIANTYFGIQAFDRKSSINKNKINENYLPVIDGTNVNHLEISRPELYFNFIEDNIKSGGDKNIYSKERIVIRQIGKTPIVGYCPKNILTSNTIYNIYINSQNEKKIDLKFILLILGSSLIKEYWIKNFSDNKDTFPKIKGYQLKKLPIPKIPLSEQQPFIAKADQMLEMNKQLHDKIDFVLRFISSKFGLEKLSTKLQKFYDYDFATFLKELKFKKLSMSEEAELMDFFETKKSEIVSLKNKIDATDREIDEMVYTLYGLNDEEKKVVEGS